jgi:hypothetical protein
MSRPFYLSRFPAAPDYYTAGAWRAVIRGSDIPRGPDLETSSRADYISPAMDIDRRAEPGRSAKEPTAVPGPFRRLYRVLRWMALGVLGTALLLILWTAPPQRIASDPQASQRLETKLRRFGEDARLGVSRPLRLDEAELNSWMKANLALPTGPAPGEKAGPTVSAGPIAIDSPADLPVEEARSNVRDVRVHLAGDQVTGYVLFNMYGKDLSLTLVGRLSAQGGYLRLSPNRMTLGLLPIPQAAVERAVRSLLDSPQNRDRLRLPPDIRDLRVENGELVVTWR